jgi:hypothetical protein
VIRIGASVHIFHTSLESLDLPLLETIGNGGIFIRNNTRLCYVNRINWNYIRLNPDEKLTVANNADPKQCGETFYVFVRIKSMRFLSVKIIGVKQLADF